MPTTFREYLSDSLLRAGSERALDRRELEHGIATESIDSPGYATTARGREAGDRQSSSCGEQKVDGATGAAAVVS